MAASKTVSIGKAFASRKLHATHNSVCWSQLRAD